MIGPLLAGYIVDYSGSYQWGIAFALAMATFRVRHRRALETQRPWLSTTKHKSEQ